MKKQNRGVILSRKDTLVSVIDELQGRFIATTFRPLLVGGLYEYDLVPFGKIYSLFHEELVMLPFDIAQQDILFLHHILEICLLFAPVGSCAQGVFQLFFYLYTNSLSSLSQKFKKFVIFKLLSLLGIWPHELVNNKFFFRIAETPIDRLNQEIIDLVSEKEIGHWIYQSMRYDPIFEKMKTKLFLERIHHDE